MTNASDTLGNSQAGSAMAPLRAKSGWIVALGVVYVIAGLVALGSVVMATVASVLIVGVMMIVAGVAEVFSAFQIKSWGKFLLWVLLGLLYIIAGFVTFENPLLAAALLTLILGASLLASGVMRIILAFSMKQETPWIWVLLSGVITLLLGLLILAHWPVSSLYILGLFLGIDLIFAGVGWIGLGLGLRRGALPSRAVALKLSQRAATAIVISGWALLRPRSTCRVIALVLKRTVRRRAPSGASRDATARGG
jgi:uncharacterized membrane protein HdeD (DUF308 family)